MSIEIVSPEILSERPVGEKHCQQLGRRALDALIIVPPPSPSETNPPLGPAVLMRKAEEAGYNMRVIDWNASYTSQYKNITERRSTAAVGDHGKDRRVVEAAYKAMHKLIEEAMEGLGTLYKPDNAGAAAGMHYSFEALYEGLARAKQSPAWQEYIQQEVFDKFESPPPVIGVSVMGPTQIFPALLVFDMIKDRWPEVTTVLGGSHATLLRDEISSDPRYTHDSSGRRIIDVVLPGHSEEGFMQLISDLKEQGNINQVFEELPYVGDVPLIPSFNYHPLYTEEQLKDYDKDNATLGVQFARGCPLKCTFCTYPLVEPLTTQRYEFNAREARETLATLVEEHGIKRFSIKDSLFQAAWMKELADELIKDGPRDIKWSATTKIVPALKTLAPHLAKSGLATLEFGIETIHPEGLELFKKKHPKPEAMEETIMALTREGITVVTNLIFGLPNETQEQAMEQLRWAKRLQRKVRKEGHPATVEFSFNSLDIARGAPLVEILGEKVVKGIAPWAGVYEWHAPSWRETKNLPDLLHAAEMEAA